MLVMMQHLNSQEEHYYFYLVYDKYISKPATLMHFARSRKEDFLDLFDATLLCHLH